MSDVTQADRPPRRFDLAVLDIAGTTVEEHQAVYGALEHSVAAAGASPSSQDIQAWMGADKHEAIAALLTLRDSLAPSADEVDAVYGDFRERLRAAYDESPPTPLPGVVEALVVLREAGVKVALTTGFTREVTDSLLGVLGWTEGVVDAVVCAEEVGSGRPAPFLIFEAMRRTGVTDVRRVVVAGDTRLDLEAGMNAGAAAVIGVLTGAMNAVDLGCATHTHLLGSVADVPDLILD